MFEFLSEQWHASITPCMFFSISCCGPALCAQCFAEARIFFP